MKINNIPTMSVRANKNNSKNLKLINSKILFWFLK